jgi:hypothetical protein
MKAQSRREGHRILAKIYNEIMPRYVYETDLAFVIVYMLNRATNQPKR